MQAKLDARDARSGPMHTAGLPIDLRPGQSIALAADGSISFAGLKIVPVEFGTGRIRILVRHPTGRVVRKRNGTVHELSLVENP